MKLNTDSENLNTTVNSAGEIVQEVGYVKFLREQGFNIEEVTGAWTVESEDNEDTAYLVQKIVTYQHPRNHPEHDIVEDEMTLTVCSCWSYRDNSTDVSAGETPGGTCKHIKRLFREEKARADDQQETIV